tara:strand:+ start:77 stop:349 length:273 start_codon:yes stop_codon:yes gene_type:complete
VARRKNRVQIQTREGDDIKNAEPGDFCYYLNMSNKPSFAEIKNVVIENDILLFQLVCQQDFKFMTLPFYYCAFDQKDLKGKKRSDFKHIK